MELGSRTMWTHGLIGIGLMLILVACAAPTQVSGPQADGGLEGTWSGEHKNRYGGAPFEMMITKVSGERASGTVNVSCIHLPGPYCGGEMPFDGTVSGTPGAERLEIIWSGNVKATLSRSGGQMEGPVVGMLMAGSVTLTKSR